MIRRLYDAFESGDSDFIGSAFAEHVVWHEGGRHRFAGDYRGLDGVLEVNRLAAEATGGTLAVEVHDVLGSDEHVVILQQVTAIRDGVSHAADEVLVVHFNDDGQVSEVWVAYLDPGTIDALFCPAP